MVNTFENACVVEDDVYFFSYEVNGLFKINMKTGKCKYIDSLKKYDNKVRLFGDLTYVNNKIILAPTAADDFVVYDLEKRVEKYIPVQSCKRSYCDECKFFAVIPYGIEVYFVGCYYPAIVKLNLLTNEVVYYTDWLEEVIEEGHILFRHDYHVENDKIFLACSWTNKIMSFDMKNGTSSFFEVGSKERKFAGIVYGNGVYWLIPLCDNIVVKWNRTKKCCDEIVIRRDLENVKYGLSYAQSFLVGHYIVMLPLYVYPVCIIDMNTGKMKTINLEEIVNGNYEMISPIRGGFIYKDCLYIINSFNSKIYFYDLNKEYFIETLWNSSEAYKEF